MCAMFHTKGCTFTKRRPWNVKWTARQLPTLLHTAVATLAVTHTVVFVFFWASNPWRAFRCTLDPRSLHGPLTRVSRCGGNNLFIRVIQRNRRAPPLITCFSMGPILKARVLYQSEPVLLRLSCALIMKRVCVFFLVPTLSTETFKELPSLAGNSQHLSRRICLVRQKKA